MAEMSNNRAAYLRDHASEALEAVEKEVLRRRGRGADVEIVENLTLLESGLWSAIPEECWELETKIIKKQETEFRLLSPDEPDARAALEEKHPDKVEARKKLLNKLKPARLFADSPLEDEDNEGDAA